MILTIRLDNGNYLDLALDVSKRTLTFLSPIPDISREDLMELCDMYHYLLLLPISGEVIEPESNVCSIGSGSLYAMASARALMENTEIFLSL